MTPLSPAQEREDGHTGWAIRHWKGSIYVDTVHALRRDAVSYFVENYLGGSIKEWREDEDFDLAIFHRTCTHMANSGAKHLYEGMKKSNGLNEARWLQMGRDAWAFCHHRQTCPVPFVAWENPVMLGYAQLLVGKPDQTVQPWWFGSDPDGPDNCKKATCWWLKDLPPLRPTGLLDGSTARDEVFRMPPTSDPEERRMARSKFYPGMAAALAGQWSQHVVETMAAR